MQLQLFYTRFLVPTPSASVRLMCPLLFWLLSLMVSCWWHWWGVTGNSQHFESFAMRNIMFVLMVSSCSLQDWLGAMFIRLLICFYISALSSLVCSSLLHLNLLYMLFFCMLDTISLLPPKASSIQFQTCISVTDHR